MSESNRATPDLGELAFEHGYTDSPTTLWRVRCFRPFVTREGTRAIAHTEFFASEQEAIACMERLEERGADDIRLSEYVLAGAGQ